jgi:hypothetical protein
VVVVGLVLRGHRQMELVARDLVVLLFLEVVLLLHQSVVVVAAVAVLLFLHKGVSVVVVLVVMLVGIIIV